MFNFLTCDQAVKSNLGSKFSFYSRIHREGLHHHNLRHFNLTYLRNRRLLNDPNNFMCVYRPLLATRFSRNHCSHPSGMSRNVSWCFVAGVSTQKSVLSLRTNQSSSLFLDCLTLAKRNELSRSLCNDLPAHAA